MIFRAPIIHLILEGRVTRARRPIPSGQARCPQRPGGTYAVQRIHGQAAITRVRVTAVHRRPLADVTPRNVKQEGYGNLEHYQRAWLASYDVRWMSTFVEDCEACADQPTADECDLCDRTGQQQGTPTLGQTQERWAIRWESAPVWVIEFELAEDEPRFLARSSDEIYTTNPGRAMTGEPEAVGATELERQVWQAHNRAAGRQTARERMLEQLRLEDRVKIAEAHAREKRIVGQVRDEVRLLRHMQRRGRPVSEQEKQLIRIEKSAHLRAA